MLSRISTVSNHSKMSRKQISYPQHTALLLNKGTTRTVNHWYTNVSRDRKYIVCTLPTAAGTSVNRGIYVSSDSGVNFTRTYTTTDNFTYIAMSDNGQYMYVIALTKVYYSSNYGQNWSSTTVSGSSNLYAVTCNRNGDSVYCINFNDGNIYRSTDYGSNFSLLGSFGVSQCICLILCEDIGMLFTNTQANTLNHIHRYKISDGTITRWNMPSTNNSRNCGWVAVSADGQCIYAAFPSTTSNQVFRTTNGGTNWNSVNPDTSKSFNDPIYCSPDGKFVYYRNAATSVYVSSDFGSTWTNSTVFSGFGYNLNQANNTAYAMNGTQLCLGT